ncbi:MAG: hypothetical protein JW894_16455 [Bacteroidales bacterium]|nr:hypothetical protein [Bacteroidales bacterium]
MRTVSKLHIFYFTIICLLFLILSCEKTVQHPVPEVPVNFSINIQTDPEFFDLQAPGNSVVVTNYTLGLSYLGYDNNGLIIYNAGGYEFYVFDRTCPHDIPESIIVESDGTSGMATCPECVSIFVFASGGSPTVDSPSEFPLKQYHSYYNPNTYELFVYN